MPDPLRGAVAIVGVSESALGKVGPGISSLDLMAQATGRALDDAGLALADIDGLFTTNVEFSMPALSAAEHLGLRPLHSESSNVGGSAFVSFLLHAAGAIRAGLCSTALIVYGSTQLSGSGGFATSSALPPDEAPYRPRYPASMYALATARHMHQFGTTREQLAEVAVAARSWANRNPSAYARGPLSIEDVASARMVSSPLTVRDCCLVTDGGGAVIVTSAERARAVSDVPVYVLGAGEAQSHRHISRMPDLTVTAATDSGARAFAMAGVTPDDIDVVELYDAFTINPILFLEDLGFCEKGEGGAFVEGGRIAFGGDLPVNTNGGGLSYCHPGMYGIFLLIEAVRQLRGEAGDRRVGDARLALAHGNGGVLSSQATAILGTPDTL